MNPPPSNRPWRERLPDPGTPLTEHEVRIVELAAEGLTNAEIGARIYLAPETIKTRMYRIQVKLAASNRAAIVNRAWQLGYLKPSPGGDGQ